MDDNNQPKDDEDVEVAIAALYDELRTVAAVHMRRERQDHTLQPTAVVDEAYLRLSKQHSLRWESRIHFLHIAAAQIRRILVDHARSRGRVKRGGDRLRVTLNDEIASIDQAFDLVELDQVLDRLDAESSNDRQIVELKFFAGLTELEIASVLGISERTVRRRWLFARTWLFRELGTEDPSE